MYNFVTHDSFFFCHLGGGSSDLENNMAEILNESSDRTASFTSDQIPDSPTTPNPSDAFPQTPINEDIGNVENELFCTSNVFNNLFSSARYRNTATTRSDQQCTLSWRDLFGFGQCQCSSIRRRTEQVLEYIITKNSIQLYYFFLSKKYGDIE